MRIRTMVGLPDHPVMGNLLLPNVDDGTASGSGSAPSPAPAQPTAIDPAPGAGAPAPGPNGFAEGVSVAELPIGQQVAYWRFHARKHEDASKARAAELESLRPKAEQYDALEAASKTDHDRALDEARTQAATSAREAAEADARARYGRPLLQARLESLLAGRMAAEQVATLASGLDVSAFLDPGGLPDGDKVKAFADTIPAAASAPQPPVPPVQLGAGRTTPPSTSGVAAGADLYRSLRKRSD